MNSFVPLRLLLAACTLVSLPSCTTMPGEYGDGSYSGYDDGLGYSDYASRPYYQGSAGGYYRSGYNRPYYGSSYYRGPRRHHDDDHDDRRRSSNNRRDDDDHRRTSSSTSNQRRSSDEEIRLLKVRDGTRGDVPEGYHSKEWYQKRGISLSKNVYETREGDRRGYSGSSSSSSSSSSKNKDSDKDGQKPKGRR